MKNFVLKNRQFFLAFFIALGIMLPMSSCSPIESVVTPTVVETILVEAAQPIVKAYLDDHREELKNLQGLLNELHTEIHKLNEALEAVS